MLFVLKGIRPEIRETYAGVGAGRAEVEEDTKYVWGWVRPPRIREVGIRELTQFWGGGGVAKHLR